MRGPWDLHHAYYGENAPTVFGYMLAIIGIAVLVHYADRLQFTLVEERTVALVPAKWGGAFPDIIKALAAGIAGYHVALSTISFWYSHNASASHVMNMAGTEQLVDNEEFKVNLNKGIIPYSGLWLQIAFVLPSAVIALCLLPGKVQPIPAAQTEAAAPQKTAEESSGRSKEP
jgi:hypothetical protein